MATETDLRDLLRGPDPEGHRDIDLDAVLSRTRRRRRPRVIAAQALGAVAVVGVLGTAIFVAGPLTDRSALTTAEDAGAGADSADEESASAPLADEALRWAPDPCGAPAADPAASGDLTVTVQPAPETVAHSELRVPVAVTLRNDGPGRIVGTSSSLPSLSLARAGIVVWHSYLVQDASERLVDLEPGESMTYESYVDRVICGTEADLVMEDPDNPLPRAPSGDYELRAVIVLTTEQGVGLVAASPPVGFEIR